MHRRTRPKPESVFWSGYWDRIADRLHNAEKSKTSVIPVWARLREILRIEPRWIYHAATATALIIVGVFIGRLAFSPNRMNQQMADQTGVTSENVQLASLEQRTGQYLERSKILLLGLINFDTAQEDPTTLNLTHQTRMSQDLVQEAASLKVELKSQGEIRLRDLVADLEVILLQIANLESEVDLSAIEMVRSGVDRRGILLKINLEEMRDSKQNIQKSEAQNDRGKISI